MKLLYNTAVLASIFQFFFLARVSFFFFFLSDHPVFSLRPYDKSIFLPSSKYFSNFPSDTPVNRTPKVVFFYILKLECPLI